MNDPSTGAIRPLLMRIGLDEKEVEVYLTLLSMKIARASAVAVAAKQSRSNTYLILRSLEKKGLVAEVERGKIIHFVAEAPQRLLHYIQEREKELKSLQPLIEGLLPALSSLTKPLAGAPRVTMLQGREGMRQLYRDALSEEICGIFNPTTMYHAFGENIVTLLFGKHAALRGRDLLVSGQGANRYLSEVKQGDDYMVKILPEGTAFETDTIIFGDTVALFAYDDLQTIVRIQSGNVANAFRAWFEILWTASSSTKR